MGVPVTEDGQRDDVDYLPVGMVRAVVVQYGGMASGYGEQAFLSACHV